MAPRGRLQVQFLDLRVALRAVVRLDVPVPTLARRPYSFSFSYNYERYLQDQQFEERRFRVFLKKNYCPNYRC